MEPFEPIPGRVPRKVAIDRLKKEYASFNIDELLLKEGIYYDKPPGSEAWLTLELFDDNTFDDYSNEEWIAKAQDSHHVMKYIPGKAFNREETKWMEVLINQYTNKTEKFNGIWVHNSQAVETTRINLLFDVSFLKCNSNQFFIIG